MGTKTCRFTSIVEKEHQPQECSSNSPFWFFFCLGWVFHFVLVVSFLFGLCLGFFLFGLVFFFPQQKVNYKVKLPHHFCKGKVPVPSQAPLVTGSWSRATVLSVQLTQVYLLCTSAAQLGAHARQSQRSLGAAV